MKKKMSDELKQLLDRVHDGITTFNFDGKETPCIEIDEKKYDANVVKGGWTVIFY